MDYHTKVLPCIQRLGMLGAYAQVLELETVFQTWRDSTCCKGQGVRGRDKVKGGLHTRSYLVCKDLGCLEHMHKCWSLGECCRSWSLEHFPSSTCAYAPRIRRCLGERQGKRGVSAHQVLPCLSPMHRLGMLGAYAQVLELGRVSPRLGEIDLSKLQTGVRIQSTRSRGGYTQGLTLYP